MNKWIITSRPKTLTAAISPVLLGSALAYYEGSFNAITFISAEVFLAIIPIDILLPTPLPEKIPTRCPFAIGINPSILLINYDLEARLKLLGEN